MIYDKELAIKLKEKFDARLPLAINQYNYYIGKTDVMVNYPETDRSNRKVTSNFIKSFVDEEVSFMVGLPITYASKGENAAAITDIESNFNNISTILDIETATNLLIFGENYELNYFNGFEFMTKQCNLLNSIAFCDVEGNVQLFIYFYYKELDDTRYMEIVDDNYIYHFDDEFNEVEKPTKHIFGFCPVGISKLPNGEYDTLYQQLHSLQDAYDYSNSDYGNEISDTRLAYLVLTGLQLDDESDTSLTEMKKKGIMQIPDSNGKAEFLVKNIPSDFIKTYRDILKEDIYRVAQHIDNQTQVQSNTSGTMLSTRLNCLRLKITSQNQALKNCIRTRLKCLFAYLKVVENKDYDYKDITINPQLNLPSNDVEVAQIMTQLNGKLSIKTGLSRLSFVTNADEEFNRMLEEQKLITENSTPQVDLNKEGI